MISYLNIGRIFYWIYQNCCLLKVPLLWRALGLQAIEGLIMLKLYTLPSTMEFVNSEDLVMHHYCGFENLKPFPTYNPFKDLNNENFVFVMPHDFFLIPMWTGKTQNDVVKNDQTKFQKF
jgi:hypothetical protein